MKIGIIGAGVVGHATARSFIEHVDEVRVHDRIKAKETHDLSTTLESDLIFLCLPTPQSSEGLACDTSAIDGFFQYGMPERFKSANLVLRSTVPIGTTRRLREQYGLTNIVHSPEFLTARCAVVDAQMPARNIIGSPGFTDDRSLTTYYGNGDTADTLHALYERRFPGVPVLRMTSDESEAVKVFQNSIFAVTVSLWNELQHFAEKAGLDWERVRAAILADGRIANAHSRVPGNDGFGFSGTCLPKDLASFVHQYRELLGFSPWVTKAAHIRNAEVDRKRS